MWNLVQLLLFVPTRSPRLVVGMRVQGTFLFFSFSVAVVIVVVGHTDPWQGSVGNSPE